MSSVEQKLIRGERSAPDPGAPSRPDQASVRPATVWLLIALQLLLGLGAVFGGGVLILASDGSLLRMPMELLEKSPFTNFLIPGLLLFFFIGVFPLAVAYGLWQRPAWRWLNRLNPFRHKHWSWAESLAAGVAVLVWILVEVIYVGLGWAHVLYLVWGAIILTLTLLPTCVTIASGQPDR